MISKKELKEYRSLVIEMGQIEEVVKRLRAKLEAPALPKLSLTPKGTPTAGDAYSNVLIQIQELVDRYERNQKKIADRTAFIESEIERLSPRERIIMRGRYIEGLTWTKTAKKAGVSNAQARRDHERILEKMSTHEHI